MLKKVLLASGLAVIVVAPAVAQQRTSAVRDNDFSYTYGQLAYDRWDLDGAKYDAFGAEGSVALDEHLFVRGALGVYEGDNVDADGMRISAGLGFHTPLQRGLDFVASGDLIYDEVDVEVEECTFNSVTFTVQCSEGEVSDDDIGIELRGGVRHATTDQVELSGGLSYLNVYDSDLALYGQALLKLSPDFDLGARLTLGGDRENVGLFARYNF